MAYALSLPPIVTDLVYSLRDWRFEKVRKANGTPTALIIKDLMIINANQLQICEAIGNGEEVEENEIPEGYASSLNLVFFWWEEALYLTREERQELYPESMESFQELQQQRDHILRQLYLDALE